MLRGFLPELSRMTHIRMQMSLSAIGGLILGIAVLHLWPHAVEELGENGADRAASWVIVGMVGTFLMLRLFHFHHHGQAHPAHDGCTHHSHGSALPAVTTISTLPVHTHAAQPHDSSAHKVSTHSHEPHAHDEVSVSRNAWIGTVIGLAIHTLSDGVALGAALATGSGSGNWPAFGVFLAVFLHKPLDTMTVTMLMKAGGWSLTTRTVVVMLLSTACPVGAGLMWSLASSSSTQQLPYVGYALAVAAGIFLCIALGDLLPEMEFHDHNRWLLTSLLLLGLGMAWLLRYIEPHQHHRMEPAENPITSPIATPLSPQVQ